MSPRRPFAIALALGIAVAAGCKGRPKPEPDTGPIKVTVALPKVDPAIKLFTDLTGTVAAVESVQVRPRVSGFIKSVPLEAMLRDGKFMVEKDKTVLFEIDPVTYDANLKNARAQVAVAQAKLDLAEKNDARAKVSFDRGVTSKQEYDTYVAQTAVAKAELAATDGPVIIAQQNVTWTKVLAPITGRVDKAYLTAGNVVTGGETQGTVLTNIVSVDPMYVYFDVDDQTVAFYQHLIRDGKLKGLDEGGTVLVDIKLLDEKEYSRHGKLDFAGNQLSTSTGTLTIRGEFPNADKMLIPGRYVRGRVPLNAPFEGLLIPDAAVVTDQNQKQVYVVSPDNKVVAKNVVLGPLSKGLRLVQSGLTKDDRVIVRGLQRVQPGMPVETDQATIEYPAMK